MSHNKDSFPPHETRHETVSRRRVRFKRRKRRHEMLLRSSKYSNCSTSFRLKSLGPPIHNGPCGHWIQMPRTYLDHQHHSKSMQMLHHRTQCQRRHIQISVPRPASSGAQRDPPAPYSQGPQVLASMREMERVPLC